MYVGVGASAVVRQLLLRCRNYGTVKHIRRNCRNYDRKALDPVVIHRAARNLSWCNGYHIGLLMCRPGFKPRPGRAGGRAPEAAGAIVGRTSFWMS